MEAFCIFFPESSFNFSFILRRFLIIIFTELNGQLYPRRRTKEINESVKVETKSLYRSFLHFLFF